MVENRRQTGGTCPFDNGFLDLQQQRNGILQRCLVRQQNVIDPLPDHLLGEPARFLHRDSFGQRIAPAGQSLARQAVVHRGEQASLDADHLDFRLQRLGHRSHAGDQPAAADGRDDAVEIRRIRHHFQRDSPGTRRDMRIVEGVDEGEPQFLLELAGMGIGFVEGFPFQHDIAAYALGLHDLNRGRGARHDDGDRHAQARTVIAEALAVVTRRRGDHAAFALCLVHQQQRIQRAALLVCGGELQVFELQPDFRARDVGKRLAEHGRRAHDRSRDAIRRRLNVG